MKNPQSSQAATKDDLKELKVEIKTDIKTLDGKIDQVEERLGKKLDKIANTLDGFVGVVDNLRIENEVGSGQIEDLRKRVTKLESPQTA